NDILSTRMVDEAATANGAKSFRSDAGYVYVKAEGRKREDEGYVVPVMGEKSGHAWLRIAGDYENPISVAIVFLAIVKQYMGKHPGSTHPYWETFRNAPVLFKQSER